MKRIATPIETTELCSYGCSQVGKYVNGSGKIMCSERHNSCPANRKKNSAGLKEAHRRVFEKTGKATFYDYSTLPEETKHRMNHNKGKTAETYEPVRKRTEAWKKSYSKHKCNATPKGVAADPSLRWKRNKIPYIDWQGNKCVLESIHEWQVANELDKNQVRWIRPRYIRLADGRKYEPDFYLIDFDIYLDPKTEWKGKAKKYQGYSGQDGQLEKIKQVEKELGVKILILWSSDKRSFSWKGIEEQIRACGEIGKTQWT